MKLFELVFIACLLIVMISCLRIGWLAIRRRREAALRNLKLLGCFMAIYVATVIVVAFLGPQRVFQVGETICFDEWCISVDDAIATRSVGTKIRPVRGRFLLVTLRVSSRARRVRQSEPRTEVYLLDGHGTRYEVAEAPQQAFEASHGRQLALGTMLDPGASFVTVRVFDIPRDLSEIGLALRQTGIPGPGLLVIGDDASLFHRPAIFRIAVPKEQ